MSMYNNMATQNIYHRNHILLLMGGCTRISYDVLGSYNRPFFVR